MLQVNKQKGAEPGSGMVRYHVMHDNELVNLCVDFIPLPIHPCPENWNKSFVEIQFNLFMLKCCCGKQLTELMVLLTPGKPCHKPGSVMSAPPPTLLTFLAHSNSRRVSQLAKGITSKFLQTPDVFKGSTQREETFSILCKHLLDKSLCHGGDISLEWVKGLH